MTEHDEHAEIARRVASDTGVRFDLDGVLREFGIDPDDHRQDGHVSRTAPTRGQDAPDYTRGISGPQRGVQRSDFVLTRIICGNHVSDLRYLGPCILPPRTHRMHQDEHGNTWQRGETR